MKIYKNYEEVVDEAITYDKFDKQYIELDDEVKKELGLSLCNNCNCMTKTINSVYGKLCGKCNKEKLER